MLSAKYRDPRECVLAGIPIPTVCNVNFNILLKFSDWMPYERARRNRVARPENDLSLAVESYAWVTRLLHPCSGSAAELTKRTTEKRIIIRMLRQKSPDRPGSMLVSLVGYLATMVTVKLVDNRLTLPNFIEYASCSIH
jgi:hypothetical protein